eukprot:scaffold954_cov221-Pinguiococcus_pyrenoidosus.AAC.2
MSCLKLDFRSKTTYLYTPALLLLATYELKKERDGERAGGAAGGWLRRRQGDAGPVSPESWTPAPSSQSGAVLLRIIVISKRRRATQNRRHLKEAACYSDSLGCFFLVFPSHDETGCCSPEALEGGESGWGSLVGTRNTTCVPSQVLIRPRPRGRTPRRPDR